MRIFKRFNSASIRFDNSRMRALVPEAAHQRPVDVDLLSLYFQKTNVPDSKLLKTLQPVVMSVHRMSKPFRKVKQLEAINRILGNRLKVMFI
jgi:hypothetical protein